MAAVFYTQYSTLKATDFKFDKHVPRESPDMTPQKIFERGRGQDHVNPAAANSLGGYMHSLSAFVKLQLLLQMNV